MTIVDALMAEYHLSLAQAWAFPLEAYLALVPAMMARHGVPLNGPGPAAQAAIEARARCKAWLRAHFTILPEGQPGPADALGDWLRARQHHPLPTP